MIIDILTSAKQDLKDGFNFYEQQRIDSGSYFLQSLISDIESLQIYAGIHPILYKKYHRLLSKRFPYAIYYRIVENAIKDL